MSADVTRSPAVEHALLTGHPNRAAAIHVLDGICSPLLPRSAVSMDGIAWEQIADVRDGLSSGEYLLAVAAQQLDGRGYVGWSTLDECRRRVDRAGNARVDEAMVMVGQRIPLDRDILDQDPMLDDTMRESIWDRQ